MPGRSGRNENKEPHQYSPHQYSHKFWNNSARNQPEAQALAESVGLEFPNDARRMTGGLAYPIRRLIGTGQDTPENYALLLGPHYANRKGTVKLIKDTRIDVLLCPPPGSPNHILSQELDVGSPRWTPRAPNAEEEEEMAKIRDMNSKITDQIGDKKDIGSQDMKSILMGMGSNWVDALPALEAAMNNRDQNVQGQGRS